MTSPPGLAPDAEAGPDTGPGTNAEHGTESAAGTPGGALRIGMHGSPRLVEDLFARCGHGQDDVLLVPYTVTDPFAPLRAGQVDLMIVKYELREPDVAVSRRVAFDARAALMRAGHPLARRRSVSLEELSAYDAFDCPGDFPPYVWDRVVPRSTRQGRAIRRVHPMTTLAESAAVLRRTDAVHLSFASVAPALPPGIKAVPVNDLRPAPVTLAWLRDPGLGESAARLVHDAEQAATR